MMKQRPRKVVEGYAKTFQVQYGCRKNKPNGKTCLELWCMLCGTEYQFESQLIVSYIGAVFA